MIGMMRGKTAALGLMVASLSWANPGFAQEKLKIRLADTYSNTHYVAVEGAQHWMKIVEEALGDRIDFEYFPAQQLGKSADMLSLMESGVADMALTSPAYIGDRLALAQVVELPGMAGTQCDSTTAFWSLAADGELLDREVFEPNGIKVLIVAAVAPFKLYTTTHPVETLDDVSGMKLRAAGRAIVHSIEALGGVPVQISGPETYQAVIRGTVEGAVWAPLSIKPYDLQNVFKFGTEGVTLGSFVVIYSVRRDLWDGLDEDVKTILEQAGQETSRHLCRYIDENTQAVQDELAEKGQVAFVVLEGEEKARWDEKLNQVQEAWADELQSRGRPARDVLNAFREALEAEVR